MNAKHMLRRLTATVLLLATLLSLMSGVSAADVFRTEDEHIHTDECAHEVVQTTEGEQEATLTEEESSVEEETPAEEAMTGEESEETSTSTKPATRAASTTDTSKGLYFGFNNDTDDTTRYGNAKYGKNNYDTIGNWKLNNITSGAIDSNNNNSFTGTIATGTSALMRTVVGGSKWFTAGALSYTLGSNDYLLVRFKINDSSQANTVTGSVRVFGYLHDASDTTGADAYWQNKSSVTKTITNTKYMTVAIPFSAYAGLKIDSMQVTFDSNTTFNGTLQVDYVYLGPLQNHLYFGFENTTAAANHFKSIDYGYWQFNTVGEWKGNTTGHTQAGVSLDGTNGTLTVTATTADETSIYANTENGTGTAHPIAFYAKDATHFQIRFKMTGFTEYGTPYAGISFYKDGGEVGGSSGRSKVSFNKSNLTSNTYVTVTGEIKSTFRKSDEAWDKILIIFDGLKTVANSSKVTIDYAYIGPKEGLPNEEQLFFDFTNSAGAQARYDSAVYAYNNYDTEATHVRGKTNTAAKWQAYNDYTKSVAVANGGLTVTGKANAANSYFGPVTSGTEGAVKSLYYPISGKTTDWCTVRLRIDNADVTAKKDGYFYMFPYYDGVAAYQQIRTPIEWEKANNGYFTISFEMPYSYSNITSGQDKVGGSIEYVSGLIPQLRGFSAPSGEELTYTIDYIHIGPKDTRPINGDVNTNDNYLYMDFTNTTSDQTRYDTKTYGNQNLDLASNWRVGDYSENLRVSNTDGVLRVDWMSSLTQCAFYTGSSNALQYTPNTNDYCWIRFRVINGNASTNASLQLYYYTDTNKTRKDTFASDAIKFTVGDFIPDNASDKSQGYTLTFPLAKDTWKNATEIIGLVPTFRNITPQDTSKPVTIEVDYIYVGPQENWSHSDSYLFFDFANKLSSTYKHKTYNGYNFDKKETVGSNANVPAYWSVNILTQSKANTILDYAASTGKETNLTSGLGTVTATLTPNTKSDGYWFQTAQDGAHTNEQYWGGFPLAYVPKSGDFFQMKVKVTGGKMGDLKAYDFNYATLGLSAYRNTEAGDKSFVNNTNGTHRPIHQSWLNKDSFFTVTIPVAAMAGGRWYGDDVRFITTIRAEIRELQINTGAKFTIDYIYVGPESKLPKPAKRITFYKTETAGGTNIYQNYYVGNNESEYYFGLELPVRYPTKSGKAQNYNETYHYTFKYWSKKHSTDYHDDSTSSAGKVDMGTTTYTADTALYPIFTRAKHSFTYTKVSDTQHRRTCNCGYTDLVNHTWGDWYSVNASTHRRDCEDCEAYQTGGHGDWTYTKKDTSVHYKDCGICEYQTTESHSLGDTYTDTKDGSNHQRTCSKCSQVVKATHTWGPWEPVNDTTHKHTCTAKGCGATETKAHSFGSWTTGTTTQHQHTCSLCNMTVGADHAWTLTSSTKETCTTAGTYNYKCDTCGRTKTETVTKLGHDPKTIAAVAATCTTAGNNKYYQCTRCSKYFTDFACTKSTAKEAQTIAALGHIYTGASWENYNNSSNHRMLCTRCGKGQETEAHKFGTYTLITDGKNGTHADTCSVCNYQKTAVAHTWDAGEVTKAPTLTASGTRKYTCTAKGCGATYTETLDPLQENLYFEFTGDDRADARYGTYTYGFTNFDSEAEKNWWYHQDVVTGVALDNDADGVGTMSLTAKSPFADKTYPAIYADTSVGYSSTSYPLNYDPQNAEFFQIRFKMKNFRVGEELSDDGETTKTIPPYVMLSVYPDAKNERVRATIDHKGFEAYLDKDEYVIVTLPIKQEVRDLDMVRRLRVYFGGLESIDGKTGQLTIDYIYIGSQEELPNQPLYFEFTNKDNERYFTRTYGYTNFDDPAFMWKDVSSTWTFDKIVNDDLGTVSMNIAGNLSKADAAYWYAMAATNLHYHPGDNDVFQIRLKIDNLASTSSNGEFRVGLYWRKNGDSSAINPLFERRIDSEYIGNGYFIVTIPMKDVASYVDADYIHYLKPYVQFAKPDGTTNANITIDYIYLGDQATVPSQENLYFEFTDKDNDRYNSRTYGFINFDDGQETGEKVHWAGTNAVNGTMSNAGVGTLTFSANSTSTSTFRVFTAKNGTSTAYPLEYDLKNAEFFQVRFKMKGFTPHGSATPQVWLSAHNESSTSSSYTSISATATIQKSALSSDTYVIVTLPITDKSFIADSVQVYFNNVESTTGTVTIDYIYVGSQAELPNQVFEVRFLNYDNKVLQDTVYVAKGATAVYYKTADPSRNRDNDYHYSFTGWNKALTNIQADTDFVAQYSAEAHKFEYKSDGADTHTGTCSVCGKSTGRLKHKWGSGVITTPATCENDGVKTYTCTVCGEEKTEAIPATGHNYVGKVTKEATCTENGEKTFTCKNDANHTYTETIPAINHKWDSGKQTTDPTCTEAGVKTYTCQNDASHTKTEVIPALGHAYIDGAYEIEPTCTVAGKGSVACSRCDYKASGEWLPALTHDYQPAYYNVDGNIVTQYDPAGNENPDVLLDRPFLDPKTGEHLQYCTRCGNEKGIVIMHFWPGSEETRYAWEQNLGTDLNIDGNNYVSGKLQKGDSYLKMNDSSISSGNRVPDNINHIIQEGDIIEIRMKRKVTAVDTSATLPETIRSTVFFALNDYDGTEFDNKVYLNEQSNNFVLHANVKTTDDWQVVQFAFSEMTNKNSREWAIGKELQKLRIDFINASSDLYSCDYEIDYIYIGQPRLAPSSYKDYLLFHFSDNFRDRLRYASEIYQDTNFDANVTRNGVTYNDRWHSANDAVEQFSIISRDAWQGDLHMNYLGHQNGFWLQTILANSTLNSNPLRYAPKSGDYMQIRFKTNGLQYKDGAFISARAVIDGKPVVSDTQTEDTLWCGGVYVDSYVLSGEYAIVSIPLSSGNYSGDVLQAVRAYFACVDITPGTVDIDYIYVGPKDKAPMDPEFGVTPLEVEETLRDNVTLITTADPEHYILSVQVYNYHNAPHGILDIREVINEEFNLETVSVDDITVYREMYLGWGKFSAREKYRDTVNKIRDGERTVSAAWKDATQSVLREADNGNPVNGYRLTMEVNIKLNREATIGGNNVLVSNPDIDKSYVKSKTEEPYIEPFVLGRTNVNVPLVYDYETYDAFADLADLVDLCKNPSEAKFATTYGELVDMADANGKKNKYVDINFALSDGTSKQVRFTATAKAGANKFSTTKSDTTYDLLRDNLFNVSATVAPLTKEATIDSLNRPIITESLVVKHQSNYYAPKIVAVDFAGDYAIDLQNEAKICETDVNGKLGASFNADKTSEIQTVPYTVTAEKPPKGASETTIERNVYLIPANVISFEETAITLTDANYTSVHIEDSGWNYDGTAKNPTLTGAPDEYHGYDQTIAGYTDTYSMGKALVGKVPTADGSKNLYSVIEFTGTGLDIFASTGRETGLLIAEIYEKSSGELAKRYMVNTYYNGETIHQAAVVHCTGLTYGTYTVKLRAFYNAIFDLNRKRAMRGITEADVREILGLDADEPLTYIPSLYEEVSPSKRAIDLSTPIVDGAYYVIVDGYRVYNTLGKLTTDNEAYYLYQLADELDPTFINLRNELFDLNKQEAIEGATALTGGAIFISGTNSNASQDSNVTGFYLGMSGKLNVKEGHVGEQTRYYLVDATGAYLSYDKDDVSGTIFYVEQTDGTKLYYVDPDTVDTNTDNSVQVDYWKICLEAGQNFTFYDSNYEINSPQTEIYLNEDNGIAFNVNKTLPLNTNPDVGVTDLYFGFGNTDEDKARYDSVTSYGGINYDDAETTHWYGVNGTCTEVKDGDLTVVTGQVTADEANRGFTLSIEPSLASDSATHPLSYDLQNAEYFQIRLKMKGFSRHGSKTPYIFVQGKGDSNSLTTFAFTHNFSANNLNSGEYFTFTIPVTEEYANFVMSQMNIVFGDFDSAEAGEINVDYIYLGSEENLPQPIANVYVSLKSIDGTPISLEVYNRSADSFTKLIPNSSSRTEMYYDVTRYVNGNYVLLRNGGSGMVSICNIKVVNGRVKEYPVSDASKAVQLIQQAAMCAEHEYRYYATEEGTHTAICQSCIYSEITEHSYEDGVCSCGKVNELPKEPIYDGELLFGHSLTLENDISINFIGKGEQLDDYDSFYLECKVPVYNGNELIGYETVNLEPVYNGVNYEFTLTGITAKMMNNEIEAIFRLTKDDQEYYSKTDVYSIAEYAYGKLNAENSDSLKAVCADLLRYGALAQMQFSYRTDALVDENMTDANKAYLTDLETVELTNHMQQLNDLDAYTVPWKSATLELGNKVIMCLIANLSNYAGDASALTMRLTYTDRNGETVTAERPLELYNEEKLYYAVSFDGLRATEMRTIVSAAIYEGETRVSKTVEYSVESYAARNPSDLTRAMLAYGDSANKFFAN